MKKVIVTLLVLMLVLGITACKSPEEKAIEEATADFKNTLAEIIKEEFGGELTRFRVSGDNGGISGMYVAYNTEYTDKEDMRVELYLITLLMATVSQSTNIWYDLNIIATNRNGESISASTDLHYMHEIANGEMLYKEWAKYNVR